MWQIKIKEKFNNCKNLINCNHLNWLEISSYLIKRLPVSIIIGTVIGLTASLFDFFVVSLNSFLLSNSLYIKAFPIVVALITGLFISKDSAIAGAGINYVLNHLKDAAPFVSFLKKFILSVLALSGEFIAGREGPSFFMGSSLALYISKIFKFSEKQKENMALIGAGAFTSALLKAPLGGAIFALEIKYVSDMEYESFPDVLIASIFSYIVYSYFRGVHSLINLNNLNIAWQLHSIPVLMTMGIVIATAAYLFINLFHFSSCLISYAKPILRPIIGTSLALPFIILLFTTDNLNLLSVSVNYMALTTVAKTHLAFAVAIKDIIFIMFITSFAIGSGISGGIILPSLLIGALLGNITSTLFGENLTLFALSGMAAFLAAVAKTPLAAIVLILEMSQTDLIIPLTASVIASYVLTYGINIYESQKICKVRF